ncbi:hypothetical protein [Phenylobacterium sp.]|uniref:hypothetical protein n=1 Tax=Phenylobacterium sp. TaxID=1871053 RepID=UPI002CEC9523|nr:hypothetical protein [Phenylobacterium sp.]HLZ75107.1 hypothetical protein [Phenylobacterium sp.]
MTVDPATALATANLWIQISTAVVAAGVTLEFFDLLFFSKEMTRLQRWVLFLATIMIVLGCGGEFVFERQASQAEAALERAANSKIAELSRAEAADNKIAQQAARDAAALGTRVGTVSQQIDEASNKERTMHGALLADENRVGELREASLGRHLTKQMYEALASLKGKVKVVNLASSEGCSECSLFRAQIEWPLDKAGVMGKIYHAPYVGTGLTIVPPEGIEHPENDVLMQTLTKVKLYSSWGKRRPEEYPGVPPDEYLLVVGEKYVAFPAPPYMGPPAPKVK